MLIRKVVAFIAAFSAMASIGQYGVSEETAQAKKIVLQNEYVTYIIGADGKNLSFVDKRTGKGYCKPDSRQAFAIVKKGEKMYECSRCSYTGGRIRVEFGSLDMRAVVKVTSKPGYFVFEVVSVSDPEVDEMKLLNLRVSVRKYTSRILGQASDDEFAVCIRALNLQTNMEMAAGPTLCATCYRRFGLKGAKAALIGCPRDLLRETLKDVIRGEGLPYSPVGGPWALDAEAPRGSYLFGAPSEKNVDKYIALAKRAGIKQIIFCGWGYYGHYKPHRNLYPHGVDGLKGVIAKLHKAELGALMHTGSWLIHKRDAYVTPVPDKRLAKKATFTLAAAVTEDATIIPTAGLPKGVAKYASYFSRGTDIQIDDEIIAYSGVSPQPPYGFTGCKRGAYGTKAAPHKKGAAVGYLITRYNRYMPDLESSLAEELARNIADIFNTCGFDGIYFDGLEAHGAYGPFWHYGGKTAIHTFSKFKRQALMEGAAFPHHMWPVRSKVGAWDTFAWGVKRGLDRHCRNEQRRRNNTLLPVQLGWWRIRGPSRYADASLPDHVEYLCCKCLANDMSFSLQGVRPTERPPNARQDEYLTIMGQYERLRLAGHFSESVKEKLRVPGDEFKLVKGSGGKWRFLPVQYAAHKVTAIDGASNAWKTNNKFGRQPVQLRIQALMSAEPYEGPDGLVAANFDKAGEFGEHACARKVTCALATSADNVKSGRVSGCFSAKNASGTRKGAWAKVGKVFSPAIDFRKYDGLGVWVHGDGKGELLNIQLRNADPPVIDDHYVDVDFKGWRYFELLFLERDAERYYDYVWPYRGIYHIHRYDIRAHVDLNIYYNNLPPGEAVKCYLSPIKALRAKKVKLRNPTVAIGGKEIVFPVDLESRCYIEFESMSKCRLYDERGALVQEVQPRGKVPLLAEGDNLIKFTCEGPEGFSARAKVTVITCGKPLQETAAGGSN